MSESKDRNNEVDDYTTNPDGEPSGCLLLIIIVLILISAILIW